MERTPATLRARLRSEESGLTLIELLIASILMLVVIGVATDGLFNLTRSSTAAQLHSFSLTQNRVGVERLTYLLRQATYGPNVSDTAGNRATNPIIAYASPNKLIFTSRGAGESTPTRFTAELVGNTLKLTRSTCTLSADGKTCTWVDGPASDLVQNVKNAVDGPCGTGGASNKNADGHTFRYFATNSPTAALQEVNTDAGPLIDSSDVQAGQPGSDIPLSTIDTVQISLWTQESGAGVSNTCESLSERVNIRNLIFSQ